MIGIIRTVSSLTERLPIRESAREELVEHGEKGFLVFLGELGEGWEGYLAVLLVRKSRRVGEALGLWWSGFLPVGRFFSSDQRWRFF